MSEIQFAGKISGMENLPCTIEEFDRIKSFYKTFKKLTEHPETVDDFEYEKQKLLCNVKNLWPLIEKLCKQFNISLERENIEEDRTQAACRYARAMSGKADTTESKSQPQKKELIALDLIKSEIHSCQKTGDSVESGLFPKNLASPSISKIKLSMQIHRRYKIKQILAAVLARLCVYYDEEITTQSSPQKPAETEQCTAPAKDEKAKKLHEIADALKEWGKYNKKVTNSSEWNTPAAKQIIRKAMILLVDNLDLLNECKNKYGCHGPLQQYFGWIEQVASRPKTKDLGDCRGWTRHFTECHLWDGEKRSLADECIRYANKITSEVEHVIKAKKKKQEGMIEPNHLRLFRKSYGYKRIGESTGNFYYWRY